MSKTFLFVLLTLLPLGTIDLIAQGARPSNIYRVAVTSRYVLEGGERTSTFYAVNQEISDSLGRMHTEIDYNWETRHPDNYRWHYFDSMLHVRTDFFVGGGLESKVVYEHNYDSLIVRERHYKPLGEDTLLYKTIDYDLGDHGLLLQAEAFDRSGRRLYRARSTYDDQGVEIRRRVTGRRGDPADGIRRLDREPVYDSLGRLAAEHVSLRMADRRRGEYTRSYKYDGEGNLIEELESDRNGNQVYRIEYDWQPNRNRITRIRHYDSNDSLAIYLARRYEIYRTTDRRQRVIDY